jgi:hypothetical protein
MQRKQPKLTVLAKRIATAQRIIVAQQASLERLRVTGESTFEAEATLRTYTSALMHLLTHADRLRREALAKKGETKKYQISCASVSGPSSSPTCVSQEGIPLAADMRQHERMFPKEG